MILRVAESDIVSFVYEVFLAFKDLAASRQIRYDFVSALDSIPLYFDKAQLEKVLFNLLSNAFKFTGIGGEVALFYIGRQREYAFRSPIMDGGFRNIG